MRKLILIVIMVLSGWVLGAQGWGGRYFMVETGDGSAPEYRAELYLIPMGKNEASFDLQIYEGGDLLLRYDTDFQGIPVKNNKIIYHYPDEETECTVEVDLKPVLDPGEYGLRGGFIRLRDISGGDGEGLEKSIVSGIYARDEMVLLDKNGYLYQTDELGSECTLRYGGHYFNKVTVPAKVKGFSGEEYRVTGIEADALKESVQVIEVNLSDKDQRIAPGALWNTDIPYDWSKLSLPKFAYPDETFDNFVIPMEAAVDNSAQPNFAWAIFKQNSSLVVAGEDKHGDSDRRLGLDQLHFEDIQGQYYLSMTPWRGMFKGYEPYEVQVLIADSRFAGLHDWPSFSRWKFPEREQEASEELAWNISRGNGGREVIRSRRVGWLRGRPGELDLFELAHKDNQAMVIFVWQENGVPVAMGSLQTEFEGDGSSSVWNVDDEGFYGIPNLVSIAIDPEGGINLFLTKDSPESVTCFILHQEGDRFKYIDAGQWYRFID